MANQTINKIQINENPETYDVEDTQARQDILDLTQKTNQLKEDIASEVTNINNAIVLERDRAISAENTKISKPSIDDNNKFPRAKNGDVEWVEQGYVTPEMFGAVGDGITDDSDALQLALNCRGVIKLGAKTYRTTKTLYYYSNTEIVGCGDTTIIRNDVETGFGKQILLGGQIGSNSGTSSQCSRIKHTISNISEYTITMDDSNAFNVGDAVLFTDGEKTSGAVIHYVVQDFAIVTAVNTDSIRIDRVLKNKNIINSDSKFAINLSERISESGMIEMEGEAKSLLVKNVYLHDFKLQHAFPETGSGMYALSIAGYNIHVSNVNMNDVTTPFGSNMMCDSIIENCNIYFTSGGSDFAELQIGNIIRNMILVRCGNNPNHSNAGFTCNNGFNNLYENIDIYNGDKKCGFRNYGYNMTYKKCRFFSTASVDESAFMTINESPTKTNNNCYDCENHSELSFTDNMGAYNCVSHSKTRSFARRENITSIINPRLNGCLLISTYFGKFSTRKDVILNGFKYGISGYSRRNSGDRLDVASYIPVSFDGIIGIDFITQSACTFDVMLDDILFGTISTTANAKNRVAFCAEASSSSAYVSCYAELGNNVTVLKNNYTIQGFNWNRRHTISLVPKTASGYMFILAIYGF